MKVNACDVMFSYSKSSVAKASNNFDTIVINNFCTFGAL